MIPVTKSFLPNRNAYNLLLDEIWESGWFTNHGKMERRLNDELKSFLGVSNIMLTNNGTIPLQLALHVLGNEGEIITSPFSYIATSSSILWEKFKPVFVDIDADYLSINELKIEAAITSKTTAILVTHIFGNPSNVEVIQSIADKYNLSVIYDGAHCFNVIYKGKSIFEYGDVTTTSFHATKLFHTAEGGALFTKNTTLLEQFKLAGNFGHTDYYEISALGINAKLSELQAALGLAMLPEVKSIIEKRKQLVDLYKSKLNWDFFRTIRIRDNTEWNYSYFPIIFQSETQLNKTLNLLNSHDIFPRRYFYPSLNTIPIFPYVEMPVSEEIAKTIICLPLYDQLSTDSVNHITNLINSSLH